jgi:phosphate transport system ATP-binding protein
MDSHLAMPVQRQAKRISDYVAFMFMGELIEFGPDNEVFCYPKHKLTR